ncbi:MULTISPECIES: hypothetical protein [unclassified Fusobacterium]|uniref:hypothetical protein n=1 Tax=unclassified Fusobacterium TaxID=2648384 RepID=UPI001B8B5D9A|nr:MULTISPECIES: hypothetical protein [unclassified Fusobacterium]MBR8701036.1 hypothetical protein [Fusobacterium sp. DD45]MBR8710808.1 hypothetical protein [Fusobacterium sp. DD28]MBR8751414.1 hypothetical protein [Fusobacterium sp. DD26]
MEIKEIRLILERLLIELSEKERLEKFHQPVNEGAAGETDVSANEPDISQPVNEGAAGETDVSANEPDVSQPVNEGAAGQQKFIKEIESCVSDIKLLSEKIEIVDRKVSNVNDMIKSKVNIFEVLSIQDVNIFSEAWTNAINNLTQKLNNSSDFILNIEKTLSVDLDEKYKTLTENLRKIISVLEELTIYNETKNVQNIPEQDDNPISAKADNSNDGKEEVKKINVLGYTKTFLLIISVIINLYLFFKK